MYGIWNMYHFAIWFPWKRQTYSALLRVPHANGYLILVFVSMRLARFRFAIHLRHCLSPLLPNHFLTYHPVRRRQNTKKIVKMRTLWEKTSQCVFYRAFNWHWQLEKLKHLDEINRNVCHKNVSRLVLASRWHTAARGAHVNSKDFHFNDFLTDNR